MAAASPPTIVIWVAAMLLGAEAALVSVALLAIPLAHASPYLSASQHIFSESNGVSNPSALDVAGLPNIATRFEVTSNAHLSLPCALDGDESDAGYAHFTNAAGVEDKHMFWWYVFAPVYGSG